jgi:hypothetical protein
MFVYALDSFRPGLGHVVFSGEPGDEPSSSNAGGVSWLDELLDSQVGLCSLETVVIVVCVTYCKPHINIFFIFYYIFFFYFF